MLKYPLVAILALATAGCAIGPNYHEPKAPVGAAYKETTASAATPLGEEAWWRVFNDPTLDDLETRLNRANPSLAAADAAWREARALVAEQRGQLLPSAGVTGSAARSGSGGPAPDVNSYKLSGEASWIPDIWGATRRALEGAKATAQQQQALLANTRLSLQLELANDYVTLREEDADIHLLDETLTAYERSLEITKNKYAAGVVTAGDVAQAQSQRDSAAASLTATRLQRAQTEHAIAVLIGVAPSELTLAPASWTLAAPELPAGLPSQLARRRPDVVAAERALKAANAQIGVAEAAFFPTVTLTAQGGGQAALASQVLSGANGTWSLGAQAAETLFNGGQRLANVRHARAGRDLAVAQWRQTVLQDLQQVEDNLAAQRELAIQVDQNRSASQAADKAEAIARNAYRAGQVDYTSVVVAQASALGARQTALKTEAARLSAAINLIGALGGGWKGL
jgi:NodT family efflux transporter outer membrane factor (OMF) lipoprotein